MAISNERILGMDRDTVSLRVRDSAHGNRRRTLSVPAHTFIERFLLHVLPKGFKRIRHYGLLGPAGKAGKLARARAALSLNAIRSAIRALSHTPARVTGYYC
ncbi:MAG: transposase [Betaproteobacteria bacterium]|nr:transposase [Betaproteobacteria bacterium]